VAKLKPKHKRKSDRGPVVSANVRLSLDQVLNGPRPGRDDPEADRVWLDLRRELSAAEYMHPAFDPRAALRLEGARFAEWQERRARWLRAVFAGDPRLQS
jgi:hypothetical protein